MSHYTSYGTGSIEIDIENPEKGSKRPCCLFSEKLVYYLFSILAFIALILYFSYGHDSSNSSSLTQSQIKAIVGSKGIAEGPTDDVTSSDPVIISDAMRKQVTNCDATDDDKSCDVKYGCYTYQDDIMAVIDSLNTRWDEYTEYIELQTSISLNSEGCIAEKLLHQQLTCNDECESKLGMDISLGQPNLCKNTFLDEMRDTLKPYRRSCIASLIGYQYANLCGRPKDISTQLELATFNWWRGAYTVSSSWSHSDCPYYT